MPELKSKYMVVVECKCVGKTRRWGIRSKNHGDLLGWVRWYGPWRQYVFMPCEATVYNDGCLGSIRAFLVEANAEHRQRRNQSG